MDNNNKKIRFLDPLIDAQTPMPIADYMSSYTMNGNVRISWFCTDRLKEEFLNGNFTPEDAVETAQNISWTTRPVLVMDLSYDKATLLLEHLAEQMTSNIEFPVNSANPSYFCAACHLPALLRNLADKIEAATKDETDRCKQSATPLH